MELLYLSCATTNETFYLMVGFPGVFRVSSLHFITLLNTLTNVVKNHVLPMVLHDLEFNTLASVLRMLVFPTFLKVFLESGAFNAPILRAVARTGPDQKTLADRKTLGL